MENLNSKTHLAKAIISVMKTVKGIDKTMNVGSGSNSYKGVSDKDVKKVIGDAMAHFGLCLLPIDVDARVQVERWSEIDSYSKETPKPMKSKQSVFTEAKTKYLLLHESGESIELSGYGQGVDTQDKGAGKATTYALKYTMLYTFLIPTGTIDDTDNFHSDHIETPVKKKPSLNPKSEKWPGAIAALQANKTTIDKITSAYELTDADRDLLLTESI